MTLAQHFPKALAGLVILRRRVSRETRGSSRQEHVEHPFLRAVGGAVTHFGNLFFSRHFHGDLHKIAHDRVHFAPDIAHFSELGGLNLDERCLGQARQPSCDFGLADSCGADHENVLRRDFGTQRFGDLASAPAIAQGDRDRALGRFLAHDVLIQLFDYFTRGHLRHGAL
jgi:hypothetical protein